MGVVLLFTLIYLQGGPNKVYLAFNKMNKEEVAIKFIKMTAQMKKDNPSRIFKEADSLRKLTHPSLINIKMTFPLRELGSIAIVMEYASGGELKDYL